jgi:uncharacterized protein (DUF1800 family)
MKIFLLFLAVCGLAEAQTLDFAAARHLLNRTGFAASTAEVQALVGQTPAQAFAKILAVQTQQAQSKPPEWTAHYERVFKPNTSQEERMASNRREQQERAPQLRAWWLQEMVQTPAQLTEKMTLFWHNHFTSGQDKVRSATLMYRQNQLLRQHALGDFKQLLSSVIKDPAMLLYLDQAQSRKGSPNENLARELLELFTLGEGNYNESDIKEIARALTGMGVNIDTGEYAYRKAQHDDGEKTFLGQTGRFNGDDVLARVTSHPSTARFVVRKLLREFVSPNPSETEVARLANIWLAADMQIKPLLTALFTSEGFYAAENRAALIKSPVELVAGSLRQFEIQVEDYTPFVLQLRQLGQVLFQPPNVKGWTGGETWVNSGLLLARKSFLSRVFRADEMGVAAEPAMDANPRLSRNTNPRAGQLSGLFYLDSKRFLQPYEGNNSDALFYTVLPGPAVQVTSVAYSLAGLRILVLDPVYQLK